MACMNTNDKLQTLKKSAMARNRKVIFDNDGGDAAKLAQGTSPEELIEARTKPALDAEVDTYIYTTGWGFGIGLHDSNVGSVLRTKDGHLSDSLVDDFAQDDTDCLRIISEYVKQRGTEFFWGMRMNDTHDAGYGNVFMPENEFKNGNNDVMFGAGIKHGAVTAVDYLDERVRSFGVAYIMDVVDRYSIDGLFLDFFRHPIFFRTNARGEDATAEEREAMTLFMTQVIEELNKRRIENDTYYIVSIRVPDSVEYCKAIGIDIEGWLDSGFIDILYTTSYLHMNDWNYSAELGHRFGVPVYPSLDETRVRCELPRHKRNRVSGYYGRIMNVWASDCDGVFMFNNSGLRDMRVSVEQNWFAKDAGSYQEGLAATVKGREYVNTLSKTYFASFRGIGGVAGGALPHESYINISTLNHHAPIRISANQSAKVAVQMNDDIAASSVAGDPPSIVASIFTFGDAEHLSVYLNDTRIETICAVNEHADLDEARTEYVLTAEVSLDVIRQGKNLFRFDAVGEIDLLDLWIDLEYPSTTD